MAILPIVKHPDPILEKQCQPVATFDKKLAAFLNDLYDTMIDADGVGLAAPQVGVLKEVAIVDIDDDEIGTIELINPKVLSVSGEQTDVEGCLSFPGLYGEVTRPLDVKVSAQDRYGTAFTLEAEGFLARAILHEIDHLRGILFTSKVERYVEEHELEGSGVE